MSFIAFPNLGIHIPVSPIAFTLGNFTFRWYGIMLSLAIFTALFLGLRQSSRFGIEPDRITDMFLFALPISVIFSRISYVIVEWETFSSDILGAFRLWEGGLTFYGAVFGAVLTVLVYTRLKGYSLWHWFDFGCIYLPLAQAIGRWGNFFNQELYGTNTSLPWGMTGNLIQNWPNPGVDGSLPVHPTFMYEGIWNLLIFGFLLWFRPRSKKRGQVFAAYLFLYSVGRFGLEFVRTDVFMLGNTDIRANMFAAAVIALCGVLIFVLRGKSPDSPMLPLPVAVAAESGNDKTDQIDAKENEAVDAEVSETISSEENEQIDSEDNEQIKNGENKQEDAGTVKLKDKE